MMTPGSAEVPFTKEGQVVQIRPVATDDQRSLRAFAMLNEADRAELVLVARECAREYGFANDDARECRYCALTIKVSTTYTGKQNASFRRSAQRNGSRYLLRRQR